MQHGMPTCIAAGRPPGPSQVRKLPGDVYMTFEAGVQWICNLCLQGNLVRLETANAALLRKSGESWQEAMAEEHAWELVDVIVPQSQQGH